MHKILIVEDDNLVQNIYRNILIKEGFEVVQAFNGRQALSLVQSEQPNLIILDIMLPGGMNGFDVLERLKIDEKLKNIPVLVLTNLDTEEKVALSIGAADYIVKANISINELVDKIKKYLK